MEISGTDLSWTSQTSMPPGLTTRSIFTACASDGSANSPTSARTREANRRNSMGLMTGSPRVGRL